MSVSKRLRSLISTSLQRLRHHVPDPFGHSPSEANADHQFDVGGFRHLWDGGRGPCEGQGNAERIDTDAQAVCIHVWMISHVSSRTYDLGPVMVADQSSSAAIS